ncbi:MAG TPA: HdeD family acid-resistance protein [Steroidobacteraceae bacterium]|nr:HdeD family acid-resistance protein [Steroidobacteraceae bacterium]
MSTNRESMERINAAVDRAMHEHWKIFLIEGIALLVLGTLAIVIPMVATIAAEVIVGWLLLISGVVGLVATFRSHRAPGFIWSIVSALLGIVAGIVLLRWPLSGAVSLTLILTAFLVIEGVISIFYSLDHRRELSGRWSMMLLSGIVDLVLAGLILTGLPGTAVWAIGLLIGINLVFGGVALVAMALHARGSAA